jgi:hypothetical protein
VHTPTSGLYIWGTSQIFPDTRPDTPRPSTLFHVFLCLPSPDHICLDRICPDTFPMPQPICTVLYSIYMVISDVNICRPNSEALVHMHICVARVWNKYVRIHFRNSSPYALFRIPLYMVSQESGINITRPIPKSLVHMHCSLLSYILCFRVRTKYVRTHFRSPSPYELFCISLYMVSLESGIDILRPSSNALVYMHIFVARVRTKYVRTHFQIP